MNTEFSSKYAALISYTGTRFCGWQKQKGSAAQGAPSIQETIEKGLSRITQEPVRIVGSGRTDAGVHAVGQVAHFFLQKERSPEILKKGLNSLLEPNIRVRAIQPVAMDFHAQKNALKKQYSYYFQQGPCALPHLEPWSWWIQKKLDRDAMSQGLANLLGEHDFKPFQGAGAKPGSTVRRILEAQVSWEPIAFPGGISEIDNRFGLVRVRIIGTGFLKQMVRGIAGTLLQVGESRRSSDCFQEILNRRDRSLVGPTAPGRALWLERVWYPQETVDFSR
ncbi:tRNA pseudouridine(38-40) synthase TruA [Bdellovibrionota bacterium FG-2]